MQVCRGIRRGRDGEGVRKGWGGGGEGGEEVGKCWGRDVRGGEGM